MIVVIRMFTEDLDRLQTCRYSDRVSVVSAAWKCVPPTPARFKGLHDCDSPPNPASWNPPPAIFPKVVMFGRTSCILARSVRQAEAGEDLVEDEDDVGVSA